MAVWSGRGGYHNLVMLTCRIFVSSFPFMLFILLLFCFLMFTSVWFVPIFVFFTGFQYCIFVSLFCYSFNSKVSLFHLFVKCHYFLSVFFCSARHLINLCTLVMPHQLEFVKLRVHVAALSFDNLPFCTTFQRIPTQDVSRAFRWGFSSGNSSNDSPPLNRSYARRLVNVSALLSHFCLAFCEFLAFFTFLLSLINLTCCKLWSVSLTLLHPTFCEL